MKITKFLPKPIAITFQKHDIEKKEVELKYYRAHVFTLEQLIQERYQELNRLEETK